MIHLFLFLLTCYTTTIAGVEWTRGGMPTSGSDSLSAGIPYSAAIIFVLGCHEFGHYFAARYHGVQATLPFFIPFPSLPGFLNFGTMGAVIKTKSIIPDNRVMFDIGVYGPIAGFIASIMVLVYGFTHLPDIDYLLNIHPDYFSPEYGQNAISLEFGDTILFAGLRSLFTGADHFVPPMSEIYHYPFLCVGWFGLFITALNMIPVGQLDGGHIVYSMFGETRHRLVARISMLVLLVFGLLGIVGTMGISISVFGWKLGMGWAGWLLWAAILFFVIKIRHPPVAYFRPLDFKRKVIGYISLLIFLLSFSPAPFQVTIG